ncbi:YybH family protein [Alicycliphilus denitrificans]|uniref:YybH family protein n=1 Tax=Alicycliphilus denitrificans TaxID=179636 RepID=UPI003A8057A3
MTQSSMRAAVLAGTPDELETIFYDALRAGDLERVMACWADEDDIVCIHPGGPRLIGPAAIRSAFAAMLRHGGLGVRTQRVGCVQALASAVHSVLEHVSVMLPDGPREAVVCATNVYHKTPRGWCLVTHHASPGAAGEGAAPAAAAHVLH